MNKIETGIYKYYHSSTEEEIELKNNFLKNIKIFSSSKIDKKEDILEATNKSISLPINEQLHLLHCILDTMYSYSENNSFLQQNVEKFLAQTIFNELRSIIYTIVNDDLTEEEKNEQISLFENKLNIKIIIEKV